MKWEPREIENAYAPRKIPPTMSRRARNVPGNAEGNHARRRRSVARPLMKRTIVSRTGEARPPTTRYRVMTLFPANASMIEATANATPQRDTRLHGLHGSKSERCSARIKPDRTTEMREVAPNRWAERPGQTRTIRCKSLRHGPRKDDIRGTPHVSSGVAFGPHPQTPE